MEIEAAPAAGVSKRYYKMDNTRLSFTDCWSLTKGPGFLVLAAAKLLRAPMDFHHYTPEPQSFREMLGPEAELGLAAREALAAVREQLEGEGFRQPVYYWLKDELLPSANSGALAMIAPDGTSIAKVIYVQQTHGQVVVKNTVVAFVSVLESGTLLTTGSRGAKGFSTPPGFLSRRSMTKNPLKLWAEHQKNLYAMRRDAVVPMQTFDDYMHVAEESENRGTRHRIETGVLREAPAEEVQLVRKARGAQAAALQNDESGDTPQVQLSEGAARVQVEIAKQQNPAQSWKKNVWLLVITAVIAAVSFKGNMSWKTVALLMFVLFIHELGHFAAMKWFGYQNVRMFFLPFFGAAVSGKKFGEDAWRKAIVSLMGPVPGILIGAAMITFTEVPRNPMMVRASLMFIVINLFNLLPLLPFDGGWFWHSILFSRNRWAEIAFRSVTALLLIALSMTVLHSTFLAVFAVFMLLATRRIFHGARIAKELRAEQILGSAPAGNEIPPHFTEAVVTRLNEAMPKGGLNVQHMAQSVIDIYERVTARPSSFIESMTLAVLYFGAIILALQAVLLPFIFQAMIEL